MNTRGIQEKIKEVEGGKSGLYWKKGKRRRKLDDEKLGGEVVEICIGEKRLSMYCK
jgi:hypothetical protein